MFKFQNFFFFFSYLIAYESPPHITTFPEAFGLTLTVAKEDLGYPRANPFTI